MCGILHLCSKRFQNEIKIMKYLNILDLLYFVTIMCLKLFVLVWLLVLIFPFLFLPAPETKPKQHIMMTKYNKSRILKYS